MSLRPHDPDVEHGRFFENPAIEGTAAQRLFLMTFRSHHSDLEYARGLGEVLIVHR
jgi:hypothetical protein